MRRTLRLLPLAALLVGILTIALPGSVSAQTPPEQPPQLTVRGQGNVSTRPDLAVVTLGASVRRESAGQAFNRSNELISQVFTALREQGIDTERDVTTRQFSLSPEYGRPPQDGGPAPLVAWRAVNILSIKIRDFGKIGPVVDASAAILGNEAQISGISFTLENSAAAARQARDAAIADARARAQQIAEAAGVRLVRVLSINETSAPSAPVVRAATSAVAAAPAPTEVSAGELTISVSVEIIYEIE